MLHTVYISKGNILIRFNVTIKEKPEKKRNKFELKIGTGRVRFLGCQGYHQGCYANILNCFGIWTQVIKEQVNFNSHWYQ